MTIPRYGNATDLTIRGYSLPIEYFYKGNVEVKKSKKVTKISKQNDPKFILKKLKQFHNNYVEVKDVNNSIKNKQDRFDHDTLLEYNLSLAATAITEQLDELQKSMSQSILFQRTKSVIDIQ